MKKKHTPAKDQLIEWLWTIEDEAFWSTLKTQAEGKEWKSFGQTIRKRWVGAGGDVSACNCLQGSQHCMHIWRKVNTGY